MKIAVLTFAHKDSFLLNTQIQQYLALDCDVDIFVHLDKKSQQLKQEIVVNPHVFFIKNNVSVVWGDDTMMKALLNSWDEILSRPKDYDYFIMCTGQDLLVKPNLDRFISENYGKIWLDTTEQDSFGRMLITHNFPRSLCRDLSKYPIWHPKRLFRSLLFRLLKFNVIPQRSLIFDVSNIKFYCSYNWSVIPFSVIKDLNRYIQNTPGYIDMYRDTFVPEDRFLGTLIMNSKYAEDVVWENTIWSNTLTYHSPIQVHPKVLTGEDIAQIDESSCYFARKFDSNVDIEVIEYYKNKTIY